MAFTDTLKQKAGPLPVWAWGVIIGAIVVGAMYYFNSRSSASKASDDDLTSVAYPDVEGGSLSAGSSVTNADGSTDDDSGFFSNSSWMAAAVAWMIGKGANPLTVQRALTAYLNGEDITAEQEAIINQVVAKFGLPPTGTVGVSQVTTDQKVVLQDPVKDDEPLINIVSTANNTKGQDITTTQSVIDTIWGGNTANFAAQAATDTQVDAWRQSWLQRSDVSQADKDAYLKSVKK